MLIYVLMICFLPLPVCCSHVLDLLVILVYEANSSGSHWAVQSASVFYPGTLKTDFVNRNYGSGYSLLIVYAGCSLQSHIYDSSAKVRMTPLVQIVSAVLLKVSAYGNLLNKCLGLGHMVKKGI